MAADSARITVSVPAADGRPGTAIVAEGGGQRGIYTAGVLDTFLHEGFNPFDLAIGASAGAQNLLAYFIGLPGYARRAIAELSAAPSFVVPYRWWGRCGVIDLDTYFTHLQDHPKYRLPCQHVDALVGRRRLMFSATRRSDLAAVYLEPDSSTVLRDMKASSAVPFLYKGGVSVGDEVLVDGSVADPLPVRRAHALGARRIVIVRTVPASDTASSWRQRLSSLRWSGALPARLSTMLERHEQAYEEALRFIDGPPPDVEIVQIAPSRPLRSLAFGSRAEALRADYTIGRRTGEEVLERLLRWRRDGFPHARAEQTPVGGHVLERPVRSLAEACDAAVRNVAVLQR